jgi:hypothetical protein
MRVYLTHLSPKHFSVYMGVIAVTLNRETML